MTGDNDPHRCGRSATRGLTDLITRVHAESQGVHGAHRIRAELVHGRGILVGHNAVALLTHRAGLCGLPTSKVRYRPARIATAADAGGEAVLLRRARHVLPPSRAWSIEAAPTATLATNALGMLTVWLVLTLGSVSYNAADHVPALTLPRPSAVVSQMCPPDGKDINVETLGRYAMSTMTRPPLTPTIKGSVRLLPGSVAIPALASHIRPGLVLTEHEARQLLTAARRCDVGVGGCFAAGPAGVQVWDRAFDGPGGSHGNACHLGSVDWTYDTPARHYVTIFRAMVTAAGVQAGETTSSMLARVLALAGVELQRAHLALPAPPARDPFRTRHHPLA